METIANTVSREGRAESQLAGAGRLLSDDPSAWPQEIRDRRRFGNTTVCANLKKWCLHRHHQNGESVTYVASEQCDVWRGDSHTWTWWKTSTHLVRHVLVPRPKRTFGRRRGPQRQPWGGLTRGQGCASSASSSSTMQGAEAEHSEGDMEEDSEEVCTYWYRLIYVASTKHHLLQLHQPGLCKPC